VCGGNGAVYRNLQPRHGSRGNVALSCSWPYKYGREPSSRAEQDMNGHYHYSELISKISTGFMVSSKVTLVTSERGSSRDQDVNVHKTDQTRATGYKRSFLELMHAICKSLISGGRLQKKRRALRGSLQ
jgi:hypothetical protein